MAEYGKRFASLVFGISLYSAGVYLSIQANIGLAPWEAFSMGFSYVTGFSYGVMSLFVSALILIIDVILKEKIGFGTLINGICIGIFVDILHVLDFIPLISDFWTGIMVLLLGQLVICIASYFYIKSAMGCGPRDSLMIAVGKRLDKFPIGMIRGLIEGSVLLIGWLLGAKVGVGTVIAVFGISFLLQATFSVLRFDVKAVNHENVFATANNIYGVLRGKRSANDPK